MSFLLILLQPFDFYCNGRDNNIFYIYYSVLIVINQNFFVLATL